MTTLTLNLEPAALSAATSQAILGLLTPEVKEALLGKALQTLLQPEKTGYYGSGKSPLEAAFETAMTGVAREEAKKIIDTDESVRTKIRELLAVTMEKIINSDPEKLAARMADAFVSAFKADRY